MRGEWLWTPTPTFLAAWRALPAKEEHQVLEKIKILEQNPAPDGKVKKKLTYVGDDLYRLRCGNYRIFYTYKDPYVSLLKLERRADDTYDDEVEFTCLGGYTPNIVMSQIETEAPIIEKQPDLLASSDIEQRVWAEPITLELLTNLRIPAEYHARLLAIQTEDEILDCPAVPQQYLEQLLSTITKCLRDMPGWNSLRNGLLSRICSLIVLSGQSALLLIERVIRGMYQSSPSLPNQSTYIWSSYLFTFREC